MHQSAVADAAGGGAGGEPGQTQSAAAPQGGACAQAQPATKPHPMAPHEARMRPVPAGHRSNSAPT
eukprot:2272178-Alexandrium_andersonii.AAC.1